MANADQSGYPLFVLVVKTPRELARSAAWFGVGVGVGGSLALVLSRSSGGPATQAPASPAVVRMGDDRACRAELARVRAELARPFAPAPRPAPVSVDTPQWPSGLDRALAEGPVAEWLPVELESSGVPASMLDLDCSEYPCIALLALEPGHPVASDLVQPVVDGFGAHTDGKGRIAPHLFGTPEGNFAALVFLGEDEPPPTVGGRVQDLVDARR
ncbi:MAG: hypothetical protein ABMA64_14755 [Myxococcota bacterium]